MSLRKPVLPSRLSQAVPVMTAPVLMTPVRPHHVCASAVQLKGWLLQMLCAICGSGTGAASAGALTESGLDLVRARPWRCCALAHARPLGAPKARAGRRHPR